MAEVNTLSAMQELYDAYVAAEKAILSGQSYTIGGRQLSRTNLLWVQQERKALGIQLLQLASRGNIRTKVQRIIPH